MRVPEPTGRTLVCSVLSVDIVAYRKLAAAEQYEARRRFNGMVSGALEILEPRERVIVDTGDGAAIVFPGDPEDALVAGVAMRDHARRMPMRMGINLGPVKLIADLNGQAGVIGDGIDVARRLASFAEPGQLLVSASYRDVVSRLSVEHAHLFTREGRRQDRGAREHELYSVPEELRMGGGESGPGGAPLEEPARVIDAGQNLMISGSSRASVKDAVDQLLAKGAIVISPVTEVGNKWIAACTYPEAPSGIRVDEFGLTRIISGRNQLAVADKVAEIVALGGKLRGDIELIQGVWTAVCDI